MKMNVTTADCTPGEHLTERERLFHEEAASLYQERLDFGVAREVARKDLPLSTYTEAYWKIDLHNLLHFLRLRMDSHAQKEIREYATIIGEEIVAKWVPHTWEAFEDYRLNTLSITSMDQQMIMAEADLTVIQIKGFDAPEMDRYETHELYGHGRAVFGPDSFGRWRIDLDQPIAEVYLDGEWVEDPLHPGNRDKEFYLPLPSRIGAR